MSRDSVSDMGDFYGSPLDHDIAHEGTADETARGVAGALRESGIEPGADVLEPGAGTGRIARRIAVAGYRVCGFDIDPRYVRFANDVAARDAHEVADIRDCGRVFAGTKFSAAFCPMNSLAHLYEPGDLIAATRSVLARLQPGAPFLVGLTVCPAGGSREITEDIWSGERDGRVVTQQMQYLPLGTELEELGAPLERFIVTECVLTSGEERVRTESSLLLEFPFSAIEALCVAAGARIAAAFDLHGTPVEIDETPAYRQFALVRAGDASTHSAG